MPRNSSHPEPGPAEIEPGRTRAVDGAELAGSDQQQVRTDFTTEDLNDPRLKRMHALWQSKCQRGRVPGRADFDPAELPPDILPFIAIVDVEDDRFRVRLAGTGLVSAIDREITGSYVDDLPNTGPLVDRLRWVVENAKPYFVTDQPIPWMQDRFDRYSVICMPLATNGSDVDKLLCLVVFDK